MKNISLYFLPLTLLMACNTESKKDNETAEEKAPQEEVKDDVMAEINVSYMDTTVSPADDFYQFCNGNWIKETKIPDEEKRWTSFNELDKLNKNRLKSLLNEASKIEASKGSYEQLVGDYYASFMDSVKREEVGIKPLKELLKDVDGLQSNEDLVGFLAQHHSKGMGAFFNFGIDQDLMNSDMNSPYLGQGGLGLPNKDYYFDEKKEEIREKYKEHINRMFSLSGLEQQPAEQIFNIEKQLADASMGPIELRDYSKQYNLMGVEDLKELSPQFDWKAYFDEIGLSSMDTLVVSQPKFISIFGEMSQNQSIEEIKDYLRWKIIDANAGHLNNEMVQANFDFFSTTLNGVEVMKPMWKRALEELTRNTINQALGKLFADKYFSEEAKKEVNQMVDNLMEAFKDRLETISWMSGVTKEKALNKLASFGRKLGFPDEWENFDGLVLTTDDYLGNVLACRKYDFEDNLSKFGQPVDKSEWGMPAHMVNAYYHPLMNEIAFPAGIMQPPFFHKDAELAVNYGRMGMVIGHEFCHGFDDQGSKFDAEGNMIDWWTKEDRTEFNKRAEKLGNTFAEFCPFDGVCVQPGLTMGENIADLGGATLAYYAYLKTDEAKNLELKEGFTPQQRYFIAYAQLWKNVIRDEALKEQIATDPHSPAKYRINGPLKNMPEFFEAFNIPEGAPMRNSKEKIAEIW